MDGINKAAAQSGGCGSCTVGHWEDNGISGSNLSLQESKLWDIIDKRDTEKLVTLTSKILGVEVNDTKCIIKSKIIRFCPEQLDSWGIRYSRVCLYNFLTYNL
jgi:hypothetical protein